GVTAETGRIDYDALRAQARDFKPKMIVAGWSAHPRILDFARFREIADEVGALLLTDMAHFAGLVAGGAHPSPVPYSHIVTSTTHKTLRGPRSGFILCDAERAKGIDKVNFPGMQGGPLMHMVAAKAVCFGEAMTPEFQAYARQTVANARALAEALLGAGVDLVSGGTDTHLVLVDLRRQRLTGKDAEAALERAGITVNKNTIPFDPEKPFVTSGVRIGTPALTTRGMGEDEMRKIGRLIARVLADPTGESTLAAVRAETHALGQSFPLYEDPVGRTAAAASAAPARR
ncbi:MAG TPA: serine hydroxymethyltransferase, partial [Candidatus Udaeobacter sp.]|nr:serine hydroxymethyltransferase [Candidatus Udaeobacter sp.]